IAQGLILISRGNLELRLGPLPSTPTLLTLLPREPLVELGGSIQLNCSLDCAEGTVGWRGLDTNLGNILSFPGHSILQVTNAHVTTRGTKICLGLCQNKIVQAFVSLEVYSFPDTLQLESEPKELVPGQPARLFCSLSKVYPPGGLTLSWYRGDQKLETSEPEEDEDEDELFYYRSELDVPAGDVTEGAEFRCQVELTLSQPRRHFQQARAVAVPVAGELEDRARPLSSFIETPPGELHCSLPNPSCPLNQIPSSALHASPPSPGETPFLSSLASFHESYQPPWLSSLPTRVLLGELLVQGRVHYDGESKGGDGTPGFQARPLLAGCGGERHAAGRCLPRDGGRFLPLMVKGARNSTYVVPAPGNRGY
uniref:Mucosal vascular addressin cell adhesion molecule 1 n=1 Tax=Crocodylus porosus TaxID=8502 RepID=A0A7M4F905_CROPO